MSAEMRQERSGVSLSASLPTCQLCPGCQVETWGGGYCRDCQESAQVLDGLMGEWERAAAARAAQRAVAERRRAVWQARRGRIEGVLAFLGSCAVMAWFVWETRSWWGELYEMWFGGN